MSLVDSIIAKMASWEGCQEMGDTHKKIIELYNLGRSESEYHMTLSDPWCAACIGAAATACGLTDVIPVSASCDRMIDWFNKKGRFTYPGTHIPCPGDIIFYDWDGNHSSDHVGIVTKCDGERITVLEGNVGDSVGWRIISPSYSHILGYGLPDYNRAGGSSQTKPAFTSFYSFFDPVNQQRLRTLPTLLVGSDGIYVAMLQLALIARIDANLDVDGDFGPLTKEAVLNWQSSNGLEVDGICGTETWASLLA